MVDWQKVIGWKRVARARLFAFADMILSGLSVYLVVLLAFEISQFSRPQWDLSYENEDSVRYNCDTDFFTLHSPRDVSDAFMAPLYITGICAWMYFACAALLICATLSPEASTKNMIVVFLASNGVIYIGSVCSLVLMQNKLLCYFKYNGNYDHHFRQRMISTLTGLFILVYKPLECVNLLLHWYYLRCKPDDELWGERIETNNNRNIARVSPSFLAEVSIPLEGMEAILKPNKKMVLGPKGKYRPVKQRTPFTQSMRSPKINIVDPNEVTLI